MIRWPARLRLRRGRRGAGWAHSPRDDSGVWSPTDFAKANPGFADADRRGGFHPASTGDPSHRGWGAVLIDYFDTSKINIINRAHRRDVVSVILWSEIVAEMRGRNEMPGDFVIIEFGHNDGGGINNMGRGDVPGIGDETQPTTRRDGSTEIVHTYGWYLRTFIRDAKSKGATPIVSSTTVRNMWHNPNATFRDSTILTKTDGYNPADDKVERGMGGMLEWAVKQVADQDSKLRSSITATSPLICMRRSVAKRPVKYHPADHTHTSTGGSDGELETTLIAGLKAIPDMPLVKRFE